MAVGDHPELAPGGQHPRRCRDEGAPERGVRGPARGARAPVIKLATLVAEKAIAHTTAVRAHKLLKPFPAELSTLTVIGAVERLLYAALSGQLKTNTLEVPALLISLILDGVRDPAVSFGLDDDAEPMAGARAS